MDKKAIRMYVVMAQHEAEDIEPIYGYLNYDSADDKRKELLAADELGIYYVETIKLMDSYLLARGNDA